MSFESAKPLMPASIICASEIWPTYPVMTTNDRLMTMPMSDVMIASRPFGVAKNISASAQPATASGASTRVLRAGSGWRRSGGGPTQPSLGWAAPCR